MENLMKVEPVVLEGSSVRLEPLTLDHFDELAAIGLDPEIWRWNPMSVSNQTELYAYVERALQEYEQGLALPFALRDRTSGQVIGSSRYANIDRQNRRLEIGWTWITPSHQRTRINTEAKYMLLTHAFEVLGTLRVEFKTDFYNQKSRNALARIGAVQEGIFRKHMVTASGRVRDSVYFSIVDEDWPQTKARLEEKLQLAPV